MLFLFLLRCSSLPLASIPVPLQFTMVLSVTSFLSSHDIQRNLIPNAPVQTALSTRPTGAATKLRKRLLTTLRHELPKKNVGSKPDHTGTPEWLPKDWYGRAKATRIRPSPVKKLCWHPLQPAVELCKCRHPCAAGPSMRTPAPASASLANRNCMLPVYSSTLTKTPISVANEPTFHEV